MKQLLVFQLKRLKNKNVLILMPGLLTAIGVMGLILGMMVYGKDSPPAFSLVSVYNAYTQFTFLFMIYVFISTYSDDFSNGIYAFMKQIGFSLSKCILSKAIVIYVITFLGTNVFIVTTGFISGNNDFNFLLTILLSVNFSLFFIMLFAIIISLLIKKTMTATLLGYGAFLAMNVLNFVSFGLTNPADGNSISSVAIRTLAGRPIDHYSLKTVSIDFANYGYLIAVLPAIAWDILLLMITIFLIRREEKKMK